MKVETQMLVLVGLAGMLVAVAAVESGRLEGEPEVVRWAGEQTESARNTGALSESEVEDRGSERPHPGLGEIFRMKSEARAARLGESDDELLERLEKLTMSNLDSLLTSGMPRLLWERVLGHADE